MPNTPDRGKQQPTSTEERKRQQLNDRALEETDDGDGTEEEGRIEAPGIEEDDEVTPLRTEEGETGEDEDLPDDEITQVNSNPGNFSNDREKASDAGRKGGQR
jgi:general stress protein YciG